MYNLNNCFLFQYILYFKHNFSNKCNLGEHMRPLYKNEAFYTLYFKNPLKITYVLVFKSRPT